MPVQASILRSDLAQIVEAFLDDIAKEDVLGAGLSFELIGPQHSQAIIEWRNRPENRALSTDQTLLTAESQAAFLETYPERDRVDFVLMDSEAGPVGNFSLKNLGSDKVELGKIMGNMAFRGRGIARIASALVLDFGHEYLGIESIFAETKTHNEVNIALNRKLGFEVVSKFMQDGQEYFLMEHKRGRN